MIVIYAIVSRDVLVKHLRCRSFLDLGGSQYIRAYWLFGSGTRSLKGEGNLSLLAFTLVNISRQRLNITGMRSDNALPRPVSLRLILTSRIFPRLVFPGFPYSLKTSALNSSCKCHLLKPFLFYICMSPSRGSPLGKPLAVNRSKSKLLGVNIDKFDLLVVEKINFKNLSLLQCVI